ncbi:nucleotidyltransferase domain-containing protein [Paenibacillus sp. PL91]|uniref:nucleotidyltransferase domain-containing protein n=1 Tax=Paenibacillus sp. PL91 TaxID=2729538 RepID=UPI00145C68CC|nr:nucleotidyltransferase domain-containing protein [Paenibacillus sp. PL91]MBC9202723.1 nucleotidyltransferase domain-containing protein [Paenibacillus sp. PL91]
MNIKAFLERVVALFAKQLDDHLVGVYLHGSLAMHCFNPETSDVDLLVVVKRELSGDLRNNVVSKLLKREAEAYEEKTIVNIQTTIHDLFERLRQMCNGQTNDEKAGELEFVSFAQWMIKEINRGKPAL